MCLKHVETVFTSIKKWKREILDFPPTLPKKGRFAPPTPHPPPPNGWCIPAADRTAAPIYTIYTIFTIYVYIKSWWRRCSRCDVCRCWGRKSIFFQFWGQKSISGAKFRFFFDFFLKKIRFFFDFWPNSFFLYLGGKSIFSRFWRLDFFWQKHRFFRFLGLKRP